MMTNAKAPCKQGERQRELGRISASVQVVGLTEHLIPTPTLSVYRMSGEVSVEYRGHRYSVEVEEQEPFIQQLEGPDPDNDYPENLSCTRRFQPKGEGWGTLKQKIEHEVFGGPLREVHEADPLDVMEDVTFVALTLPDAIQATLRKALDSYNANRFGMLSHGLLSENPLDEPGTPRWYM